MAPSILRSASTDFSEEAYIDDSCNASAPGHYPVESEQDVLEPIAVVGFSLKFPQEATSPESFWNMLVEKRCAMTEWPKDRVNIEAFYHPDSSRMDTVQVCGAHFLAEDLAAFDAPFFSITSAEAVSMDPQQRGLLETAYRALENAGMPMEKVAGSKTGVYTGSFADDYKMMMIRDLEALPKYAATGGAMTLLANRLSWFFNLSGPSVNLDTACSSSMIALDIACQGLRNGESSMALVAGSNTIFGLDPFLSLTNMNFLCPQGRCFSFDHRANGYARGEGFGVVVIKLLKDAVRDGDMIRAVIRSTGSNQDGRTPGITQPSRDAQESLIRKTYEKAGLSPRDTRYFEAHGTGTAVGDPTEASAIGGIFRECRTKEDPLYIGAVKSNIGHLEGASGIAGLIKTVMVLEKGVIPPNTNFERLNPKIDATFMNLKFPVSCTPWPDTGLRRASVNSFGFGGANSHVVLDDAYNFLHRRNIVANHCTVEFPPVLEQHYSSSLPNGLGIENSASNGANGDFYAKETYKNGTNANGEVDGADYGYSESRLMVWSAADEAGVGRILKVYARHFAALSLDLRARDRYLKNLAYTLAIRRSSLPWKSFAVATSYTMLRNIELHASKAKRSTKNLGIGYVFTGQGAQYSGMGRELFIYRVFQDTLRRFEVYMGELGCEWSLKDELLKDTEISKINSPEYSQPICTALQIALVELLRSFNICPVALVGHSSGEIAAAYCAGRLSLRSACKVAYWRGKLTATLARSKINRGAMLAVGLSEAAARPYLGQYSLGSNNFVVSVACINSPKNVTLSGDEAQIDALKLLFDEERVFARKLQVDVAYHHAPQMKEIADCYRRSIGELEMGEQLCNSPIMISSVTAVPITRFELCQSDYWVKNMVSPVKFSEAMTRLTSASANTLKNKLGRPHQKSVAVHDLCEIGPHSTLKGPIKETLNMSPGRREVGYSSFMVRYASSLETTLNAAGQLHTLGYPINLAEVNRVGETPGSNNAILTDLPEYTFDHSQKYWYESRLSQDYRLRKFPRLDLLGTPATDWNSLEARWRRFIRVSEIPWVMDHKVNGSIVYPAAGMLVMAIEGARQLAHDDLPIVGYHIKEATFSKTLTIPVSQEGIETQLYIRPSRYSSEKDSGPSDFKICVHENGQWSENCRGTIQVEYERGENEVDGGREAQERRRYYKWRYDEAVKSCTKTVDPICMYEHLQKIGLTFGPAFRPLQQIACSDNGEAIAEVRTFRWTTTESSDHPQPHVVHPTTLDGVAQLFSVALTKGAQDIIPTTIPTRISKLWVSDSGLSHPAATSITTYTKSAFKGYRGTESNMFTLDKHTGNVLISIESLETTTVASHNTTLREQSEKRNLCYGIEWKPDVDLMTSHQALSYSTAKHISIPEPVEFYHDLSLLLFSFIWKSLIELTGEESKALPPHLEKYVAWMEWQVAKFDAGNLPHSRPDWKALSEDLHYTDTLSSRIEKTSRQGKFFVTVGSNLLKIINGETDPLGLLFQEELAEDYYREVFETVSCCKHLSMYLDALAHKKPAMNILEVGGGTGGFTAQILSSLRGGVQGLTRYARYDFTDISTSFFEKAQVIFGTLHERLEFKALNVESDPLQQGFEPGTYDLLIASSVLHATRDLNVTMRNMRKLLKPGGKIIMFEITRPDLFRAGFVLGLLPGWWLSSEPYREWSPCITEEQWHKVLSETGFSGTDLVFQDYQDQSCHEMSIIVSTAVENTSELPPARRTKIIVEASSTIQTIVAHEIRRSLAVTDPSNCEIVSLREAALEEKKEESFYIVLLEIEDAFIRGLKVESYEELQRFLISVQELLWVTNARATSQGPPDFGMVTGLARVLRSESSKLKFISMALETSGVSPNSQAENIVRVFKSIISKTLDDCEPEYIERDGIFYINRLVEENDINLEIQGKTSLQQHKKQQFKQGPPLQLTIATPGLLDSLEFVEDTNRMKALAAHEVEFETKAVGVNFMDCLTVLGRVKKSTLGGESAGIVTRVGAECGLQPGDRVYGGMLDCFKTYTRCDAQLVTKIPDQLSFVEAAALPVTYVTAYHSLVEFARLQNNESVLIHSASGGTGQAAIQIAKYIGAEVYVTIGSEEKKKLLTDLYDIPEDHIFYSRNATFAQGIMRMTNGRGVDVALNSLSGELLIATWECMAPYGRFVEIGKKDIDSHGRLPMFPFMKNVSFGAVDAAAMSLERPALFRKSLLATMSLVADNKLHPASPLHVYSVSEVEDAFRYMQGGKNTGKTVVEISETDIVPTVLDTKPTYMFQANATYVIAGGLGGLGRSAARWMATRGARNLILLSRSGPRTEAAFALLVDLRDQGVHVEAPACDVTSKAALSAVLEQCSRSMPHVKGCIQGTMVLKDGVFEQMALEDWNTSVQPKVQGSWNLHSLLPRGMDFFILLSSIAGIIGSGGQANYAAGNTYMDALAHYRIAHDEKAVSLDLGWMKSEGVVAESEYLKKGFEAAGFLMPVYQNELHALLDCYCNPEIKRLTPSTCQIVVGLETPAAVRNKGMDVPYWMQRPTFRNMHQMGLSAISHHGDAEKPVDYTAMFSNSTSLAEAGSVVSEGLVKKLSKALSIPGEDVDTSKPLHDYAVDSLLAVELRNWFAKVFDADVAIFDIMGGSSFVNVGATVAGKSQLRRSEWSEGTG